jgi:peptide chain release factor 1
MIEMAKLQLDEAKKEIPKIEEEIKVLLIPKDPDDAKNVVVELRAGAGGDEASIFAGDLYRMYTKYCEGKGWKINLVDYNEGTSGGYKEIIFEVSGTEVYGTLKFEAGVHRVQRVPQTETQGRVHTSAASVIVLPEAEEFEVELDMQDVRIERTTSTGPGGQSVNTTYSAIKLHHEPTGMIVSCQDQKSSHKNLEKALKVLRSRLYEIELAKKQAADSAKRKSMVSSGDRSAKIRPAESSREAEVAAQLFEYIMWPRDTETGLRFGFPGQSGWATMWGDDAKAENEARGGFVGSIKPSKY